MSTEYLTVVTRKGQITIPAPIRRALGLAEGDRVALVIKEDQHVYIARPTGVVARTAGMLKGAGPALSAEEMRQAGEDAIAEAADERAK
jgi:AbrB family looped-hinge helix DNA binding protein